MPAPAILIVSKDDAFFGVLAEQAKRELGLDVQCTDGMNVAEAAAARLVIAHEALPPAVGTPAIIVAPGAPIRLTALLANIKETLVRADDEVALGGCVLSLSQKTLTQGASKKTTALTDKETQLLALLAKHRDKGVGKEKLLKEIWGVETELESHTLETHIYRLRTKLREAEAGIKLVALPGKYVIEL